LSFEKSKFDKANFDSITNSIEKIYEQKYQELSLRLAQREFYWTIGGGVIVFIVPIVLILIVRYFTKQTQQKVAELAEGNVKNLKQIVMDYEFESQLCKKSNILILSENEREKNQMISLMNQLQFKKYKSATVNDIWVVSQKKYQNGFNEDEYDLLVFNHINEELINEILIKSAKEIFLSYYTNGQQTIIDRNRINFANSKFTFYARLMEILKFHYLTDLI